MSDQSGVSESYVDSAIASAISSLREELRGEIRDLEREVERLEAEMRELASAMVEAIREQTQTLAGHIGAQTAAVVGGVAATTVMIERTKNQIESDFLETRNKLDLQTETELQVEVGKKVADVAAGKGKLDAFRSDVNARFNKSLELVYQNRVLYNLHFQKVLDEYQHKLKVIGDHIFRIRDVDVRPAVSAAMVPPERTHGLPMEVDLYRLKVRAENLDESLTLLKSSRLDEVLGSTQRLETQAKHKFAVDLAHGKGDAVAVGISVQSKIGSDFFLSAEAGPAKDGATHIRPPRNDLAAFASADAKARTRGLLRQRPRRKPSNEELVALAQAAGRLRANNMISAEAFAMFEDYLGQGVLQFVE